MGSIGRLLLPIAVSLFAGGAARAEAIAGETPRDWALELKAGGYKPLIDRERGLATRPYDETFGAGAMLLFELEMDRLLWQKIGAAGIGFSIGYAEKYGKATVLQMDDTGALIRVASAETTAFQVLPLRLMGVYRFDYGALHLGVPLVPYAKAGLVYTPWWVSKGGRLEYSHASRGAGGKWGYGATLGLSLMLDFLEPRFARDFDTDMGVNHSYVFAEYTHADVNNFGQGGLDLSSRHWMFGLALEY